MSLLINCQLGQDIPGTNGDGRRPCAASARRAVVSPSSCCSPARCPTRSRPGRSADHTRLGLTNNFTRYPRMASSAARHPCPAYRLDPAREPAQETDAHRKIAQHCGTRRGQSGGLLSAGQARRAVSPRTRSGAPWHFSAAVRVPSRSFGPGPPGPGGPGQTRALLPH